MMKSKYTSVILIAFVVVLHFVGHAQSFNYKDEIAQGTCTSILTGGPDHVYAVRRSCNYGSKETCDAVCSKLGKHCYNAVNVYPEVMIGNTETGKESLHAYKYNSCTNPGCGPNYCCCAINKHPLPNPNAFKDEIAQATCTAILPGAHGHVYAVRRNCSGKDTCDDVCSNISKSCFNALHLYNSATLDNTETGKEGLHTYRYNSCKNTGCGPNFCCCRK
ncbi:uncharacterized protein LOC132732631 [Ruditapes philippinarum]|uniref:uncharacterized protein LOC132732631 n=1 Tax=Ruditapes philippinarum TaxID=129788 RepID=UPI00295C04B3|nr:uncharacterized protein LOC132732631 [Ruditapes philippinarum]